MVAHNSFYRNLTVELEMENILLQKQEWVTVKKMRVLLYKQNIKLSLEEIIKYFESISSSYIYNEHLTVSYDEEKKRIMLCKVE